ncbi:hypothetical protein BJX70DRAFT_385402 [Aspergillus crustosus]
MLGIRAASVFDCDEVTPDCPVSGTIYGYRPNLAANLALCVIFGVCYFAQLIQLIKWWMWSFGIAMLLGTSSEVVGYVGRMQICTLGLGPAFWSAAIYLTLKHEVNVLGRQFSLPRAEWYPYIFISCDLISLSLQGAGGGLAASAGHDIAMQNAGSNVMLAGIGSHSFTAYARCVYRIAEMAGGRRNPIMQDEVGFIVLESVMCAIAVVALCITHPAYCFQQMRGDYSPAEEDGTLLPEHKAGIVHASVPP